MHFSEGSTIGGMTLFRVRLSGGAQPTVGALEAVTSCAGTQYGASISDDGRMIFSTMSPTISVWSVPLKAGDRNHLGAPSWSRDDRMLYFASASDGFLCIWVQRFAGDGIPEGQPVAAFHNHAPPNMLLSDFKGDLWSLKLLR